MYVRVSKVNSALYKIAGLHPSRAFVHFRSVKQRSSSYRNSFLDFWLLCLLLSIVLLAASRNIIGMTQVGDELLHASSIFNAGIESFILSKKSGRFFKSKRESRAYDIYSLCIFNDHLISACK